MEQIAGSPEMLEFVAENLKTVTYVGGGGGGELLPVVW